VGYYAPDADRFPPGLQTVAVGSAPKTPNQDTGSTAYGQGATSPNRGLRRVLPG